MRSRHTPQQETNVAYNPGVSYRGGEFIAQGISQAGNALAEGLQRYAQNREESAALDMSFQTRAQPLLKEMQKFSDKDGEVSPAASLVDKGADWHKFSSSQKKAFLADVVIMGDKQDRARRQQQEDDFRKAAQKLQQDQFTQLILHQKEMQRLQALSTGASVSNINSEIAQRDRIASQDNAVGQGLAAYARSGTNLNPDFSYSDYANRGFGLGNATLPEASTPFTHQQRMERAMTTPGLGGRGAVQLQDELRKLAPRETNPLELAHIGLYNAQADAARAGIGASADNKPAEYTDSSGKVWIYNPRTGNYQRRDVTGYEQAMDSEGNPVAGLGTLGGKVVKMPTARESGVPAAQLLKSYEAELKDINSPMNWDGTTPEQRAAHRAELRAKIEQLRSGAPGASTAAPAAAVSTVGNYDAELKLAKDAIVAGATKATVAKKFKERTGKDLP